jgi:hypothetical protein
VGDLAALLTAIGGLITAGAGAFVLVWNTVRTSRRERQNAAPEVVSTLADVARHADADGDGQVSAEELQALADRLREQQGGGGG